MVDNLAYQGKLDEAMNLFDSLCDRANALGLLPEQVDPSSGAFLGNFPQAFSHVGLISSAVNLTGLMKRNLNVLLSSPCRVSGAMNSAVGLWFLKINCAPTIPMAFERIAIAYTGMWRELFTRACFPIGQSRKQGD